MLQVLGNSHSWQPPRPPRSSRENSLFRRDRKATVAAIFEATIFRFCWPREYRRLTTTRVAERAGVSVGTLYQYFPNRQALIAAVIERHLEETAALVEHDCRTLSGRSLDEMAAGWGPIIKANARASRFSACHAGASRRYWRRAIGEKRPRTRRRPSSPEMLTGCRDAAFDDVHRLAFLIVTSCRSLLQSAIVDRASSSDMARYACTCAAMVHGYLKEMQRVLRRFAGQERGDDHYPARPALTDPDTGVGP